MATTWQLSRVAMRAVVMALCGWLGFAAQAAGGPAAPGRAGSAADRTVSLVADVDDDDANGVPDGEQDRVAHETDLYRWQLPRAAGAAARRVELDPQAPLRLLVAGRPWTGDGPLPATARRVALQATGAGRSKIRVGSYTLEVRALAVFALDGQGRVIDLTRSHASLQRTPPRRSTPLLGAAGVAPGESDGRADHADPDALRYVICGHAEDLPSTIHIQSVAESGAELGRLRDVPLVAAARPPPVAASLDCVTTAPIRAVALEADARHPLTMRRSVRAELGGALVLLGEAGRKLQMIRVGGARGSSVGPIRRLRAKLQVMLVRLTPGGPPPVGATDAEALGAARAALARSNALWGACGISFGAPEQAAVRLVDPPPAHLLVLGCDHGLPASGGRIRVRVAGRSFEVPIEPGTLPREAARQVAAALRGAQLVVQVSDNAPSEAGALGSSDLSVRRADGRLARIELPVRGPVSTDATLGACIGHVHLDDGLEHFGDVDAVAGTVEERALLKAFDDGDPRTVEVYVVSGFGRGGRIGESFIRSDGGAIRNAVLVDGAGLHASRASFALAHELGHVLLDDPGHTDDFGIDTPTRLMDADAAESSAFGPTRLTLEECAQAMRQSGPAAAVPLLAPWPLQPVGQPR